MPRFDIILVTFNRLDFTRRTLGSLIKSGAFEACERLILVDNHSIEEGMESFLGHMARYQKTFVLRRPQNDGWATAVNDAIGMSRAPFLFLVNNDVDFDEGFHEKMLSVMEQTNVGLLAGWRHTAHSVTAEYPTHDEMTDLPAVCWLLRKQTMEGVGLLKENGPCFTKGGNGEDTDYVQRMRAVAPVAAMKQDVAHHLTGY